MRRKPATFRMFFLFAAFLLCAPFAACRAAEAKADPADLANPHRALFGYSWSATKDEVEARAKAHKLRHVRTSRDSGTEGGRDYTVEYLEYAGTVWGYPAHVSFEFYNGDYRTISVTFPRDRHALIYTDVNDALVRRYRAPAQEATTPGPDGFFDMATCRWNVYTVPVSLIYTRTYEADPPEETTILTFGSPAEKPEREAPPASPDAAPKKP